MRHLELFMLRQNNLQRRFFMGAIMAFRSLFLFFILGAMVFTTGCGREASSAQKTESRGSARSDLWRVYDQSLKEAKYIDLTHTLTPSIPVWRGFAPAQFAPTINPETKQPYTYEKDGFEATHYNLPTDQFGTQLDPPAHWAPEFPAIDELPATYAVRPLAVISIVAQVAKDPGYHLRRSDIESWEKRNGKIPAGSVVMVRSDWSKRWPDPALASETVFPGVSLEALQFLHEERHILFHGHEPLDTDTTPTLEGEAWLMHNGYAQAEGVANLDKVPEKGCLIAIGYPKFAGGLGGYARYIAICPADWKYGVSVGEVAEAPLPRSDKILQWDDKLGMRVRK
jgi:kynurenine formamidase